MHSLAQRISHLEKTNDFVREGLNHGNLESEPEILHLSAERLAFFKQRLGSRGERMQALQESRRRALSSQLLDRCPGIGKSIAREVDAIEILVIFAAVLEMIVDLQAGAERIRRNPG